MSDPSVLNAFVLANLDVTFLMVNKTLVPVAAISQADQSSRAKAGEIATILFLSAVFIASLIGNLSLVATVSFSPRLKESAIYNMLTHLSGTCLFDSVANLTISIAYVHLVHWTMPRELCSANSFLMLFVSSVMLNTIAVLVVERFLLIRDPIRHVERMKSFIFYYKIGSLICWILTAALYCPIAVDSFVQAVAFRHRYSCGPNGNYQTLYMIILMASIYVELLIVILICMAIAAVHINRKRMERRLRKAGADDLDGPALQAAAIINEDSSNFILVLMLTAGYVFLVLPHVLSAHRFQVTHSPVPRNTTPYQDFLQRLLARGLTAEEARSVQRYQSQLKEVYDSMNQELIDKIPLVKEVEEGTVQAGMVWCRYLFDAAVPVLVYCLQADVRAKTLAFLRREANRFMTFLEKRENKISINQFSFSQIGSSFSQSVQFYTPLLFVTDQGIYLRLLDKTDQQTGPPVFRYILSDLHPSKKGELDSFQPVHNEYVKESPGLFESLHSENQAIRPTKHPPTKVVRFNSVVQEIRTSTMPYLSNTFLIDQLKGYFANKGVVLVSTDGAAGKKPIDDGKAGLASNPRSSTKTFLRGRAQRGRKKMTNNKRGAPKAPLSSRNTITKTVNKIKQPWKM